ncbi:multidrug efflux SMR transporter [Arthrobacter sp.]|uniref:DMT family transporter n=1 Tax=Arthrobacter sp. TaxID=1667 RepID=UPI0028967EAF|nr:multidrug efflux SMR transporter [Arthrobacter sp.]
MAWAALIASGMLEAVWATALGKSNNFRKPLPTIVFAVALAASMAGLSWAMLSIPVGTAYAVWVGIGAVLTAGYAITFGGEKATVAKVVLLMGIIGCVVGLKVVA